MTCATVVLFVVLFLVDCISTRARTGVKWGGIGNMKTGCRIANQEHRRGKREGSRRGVERERRRRKKHKRNPLWITEKKSER